MIIAIDFDGTIAETRFPHIVRIYDEAKLHIMRWRRNGHKVILWTCRDGADLEAAVQACKDVGITFDAVNENVRTFKGNNSRKVWADVYLDDKVPGVTVAEQWAHANRLLRSKGVKPGASRTTRRRA